MGYDSRLTNEIQSLAIKEGTDLFGVAPIERFEHAPEGYAPQDYMPDATCVISIALHLANGICDVWGEPWEDGNAKTISPYLFYGYGLTNWELGRIANLAAKRLEYKGYRSLTFPPMWATSSYRWYGRRDGELKADFSHRHAAVAAGLAEFGWSGLALAPNFGPRVRFNSIITNAPLVPSPMYDGAPLCQPKRCRLQCVRECPTQALSINKDHKECDIGERHFEYSHIDMIRCQYAVFPIVKGSGGFGNQEIPPGPGKIKNLREAMKNIHPVDKVMVDTDFGLVCGDFCGRCLHKCPAPTFENITRVTSKKQDSLHFDSSSKERFAAESNKTL